MALPIYTSAAFTGTTGVELAPNASVEVRSEADDSLVTLYEDRDGTSQINNPFQADAFGRFQFFANPTADGWRITVTSGADSHTLRYQQPMGYVGGLQEIKIASDWGPQSSSLVTRFSSQLPNAVSDFGIDNTGATDVTSAINTALQTVEGLGGAPILFPPGTYLISDNINLFGSGIGIVGFGRGLTIFKRADNSEDSTGKHLFMVGEGAANAASDITLAGFTIDGNRANQSALASHNIRIENALGVLIRDIESKNACYYGLHIRGEDAATKRITIRDCYIHDTHRDCLDIKNNGGFNEDIVVDGVVCENPGLGDVANDACFDFRGPLIASNLIARLGGTRHHGIRIRGLDNNTVEGRPSVTGFRVIADPDTHAQDSLLLIEGIEARLSDGYVEGGGAEGVQVQGARVSMSNVEARGCDGAGFWLRDNTTLIGERGSYTNCRAISNGGAGWDIDTNHNDLNGCEARSNTGIGIDIAAGTVGNAIPGFQSSNNTGGDFSLNGEIAIYPEERVGFSTPTLSSGGNAVIAYGQPFPNATAAVVVCAGADDNPTAAETHLAHTLTASGFTYSVRPNPGAVSRTVRYIAKGY